MFLYQVHQVPTTDIHLLHIIVGWTIPGRAYLVPVYLSLLQLDVLEYAHIIYNFSYTHIYAMHSKQCRGLRRPRHHQSPAEQTLNFIHVLKLR